ncbi:MAG: hypothetical protein QOJ94_3197 [Sphingomonadales bacterium]|jgi:hypothetical protein|nr:hypothetical protein [Sphingomonadales bacterium]
MDAAIQVAQRFEERVEQTADLMGPLEGAAFRQAVEAERERLIQEYTLDPAGLKTRLGLNLGIDQPTNAAAGAGGFGRLAVRTAVRATVWESVRALFRAAR